RRRTLAGPIPSWPRVATARHSSSWSRPSSRCSVPTRSCPSRPASRLAWVTACWAGSVTRIARPPSRGLWDEVEPGEGLAVELSDPDDALADGQAGRRDARQGDRPTQHPVGGGVDPVQLAGLSPIGLVPA